MTVPGPCKLTVVFDGLFLFRKISDPTVCEVSICTAPDDHHMKIDVFKKGGQISYPSAKDKFFVRDEILGFKSLTFLVEPEEENSVEKLETSSYEYILNLAAENFYGSHASVDENSYKTSFFIRNGLVEAYNLTSGCKKVTLPALYDVPFKISEDELNRKIIVAKAKYGADAVQDLSPFAKDVRVVIKLEQGQAFRIKKGSDGLDLICPLVGIPGENYDIWIRYVDSKPPTALKDCKGAGHHSEAVKPNTDPRIFALYYRAEGHECEAGCCKCVQVS